MDLLSNISVPFEIPNESGYSLFQDDETGIINIKIPNGDLLYSEQFFSKKFSDRSIEYLLENDTYNWKDTKWREISNDEFLKLRFKNMLWKREDINMFGKSVPLPRITSWYGDKGRSYKYSGIFSRPNEWNKGPLSIKQKVEEIAEVNFNSLLLNWYRDGDDYLNWHSDDEQKLGVNPVIASVSFGATRDFVIRNLDKSQKISIPLKHGTLLIMRGGNATILATFGTQEEGSNR